MDTEAELRDQLATLTRIFAMRGLLGLHGHVSVYDPPSGRIYMCPGLGWDKATTRPEDLFVFDVRGKILEGEGRRPPLEWPIHTALHATRPDALAVAHLHSPYATAFAVARCEFRPALLSADLFCDGVPIYTERRLITTPEQGQRVAELIGNRRAVLLRNHGTVVAAGDLQELLYACVLLEDSARAAVEAATLGEVDFLGPDDASLENDASVTIRARLAWNYFTSLEARWDRQPPVGGGPLA
jgi:ribulose-5-phosphate 4-epimerase/fuculose-1-phosphate aldolase